MQSILSLNRSLNGILDADLVDSHISDEPFDDSAGFRPIKYADDGPRTPSTTPQGSVHSHPPTDGQRGESANLSSNHSPNPGDDEDANYPPCDSNTMSKMLRTDFESVMDELEDAVGTIRRIWGQRATQDVAYVRPDGVLVDHDGIELRKRLCPR